MTLYDILRTTDDEITVWDEDYDIETYFYGTKGQDDDDMDGWDTAMVELSKLLDVVETHSNGVAVNLSAVIEKNIEKLNKSGLFADCAKWDVDGIMDDIQNIFAGNASAEWLTEFVYVLNLKEAHNNENHQELRQL